MEAPRPETTVARPQKSGFILITLVLLWLVVALAGLGVLLHYEKSAGRAAQAPAHWPMESRIQRDVSGPTLVTSIHPHCPCSRASIGELAKLMAHCQGKVQAFALFVKPAGLGDGWEKTDLWRSAERIPGVQVVCDEAGAEATRFQAETSGQTILYDSAGRLQWSGGITFGRGHAGDNAGRSALLAAIQTGLSNRESSSVYGCSLHSSDSTNEPSSLCCRK